MAPVEKIVKIPDDGGDIREAEIGGNDNLFLGDDSEGSGATRNFPRGPLEPFLLSELMPEAAPSLNGCGNESLGEGAISCDCSVIGAPWCCV